MLCQGRGLLLAVLGVLSLHASIGYAEATEKPKRASDARAESIRPYGLRLTAGFAFGGDEPPGTPGPRAGDGVVLLLGATATPLWISSVVGLGASVDFGFKYAAIQTLDGGFDLLRYPLVLSLHARFQVWERLAFLLASGAQFDLDPHVSRTGSRSNGMGSVDLPTAVGFLVEAGAYYGVGHLGASATLRFTGMRYDGVTDVSANNWGMFTAIYYLF